MVFRLLMVSVLGAIFASSSSAGLMLNLDAGTTDLSALEVGIPFTIQVSLSGLGEAGTPSQLSGLGGTVAIPTDFTVNPASLTKGIVPSGIVPAEFLFFEVDVVGGDIDAQFFALLENINDVGLFFSFQLTPVVPRTGTIGFVAFSPYSLDDSGFVQIGSNSLNYTITTSNQPVPEPASFVCLGGLLLLGGPSVRRRKPSSG